MTKEFVLSFAILAACPLSALSQEAVATSIDEIGCRAMLKMDAEEQEYTLLYFHGFVSGTKNQHVFDGPTLRAATEAVFDHCIDNPSSALMAAFEAYR